MLLWLGFIFLAAVLQPGSIRQGFLTLFSTKDRSSSFIDASLDLRGKLLMFFAGAGVLAMGFDVLAYDVVDSGASFDIWHYLTIYLMTLATLGLKMGLAAAADSIFLMRHASDTLRIHYSYLSASATLVGYGVMLCVLFAPQLSSEQGIWLMLGTLSLYLVLMLWKLLSMLVHSLRAILYVLLYMLTLELLPLGVLFMAVYQLINWWIIL